MRVGAPGGAMNSLRPRRPSRPLSSPYASAAAAFPIVIALADVVTEFRTEELESITLVFDGALLLVGALFLFAALASRTLTRLCVLLVSTGMCCVLIIFVFALGLIPSALLGVVAIAATLGQVRETA